LKEADMEGKGNATIDMVKAVAGLLRQHSPINLFEFVINPGSFGQTIENIFYLSFVIRNAMAKIEEDENGLPVVSWVGDSEGESTDENKQTVLEMTMKHWEVVSCRSY
jgi:non-structural maintenance of chromosomes element 4